MGRCLGLRSQGHNLCKQLHPVLNTIPQRTTDHDRTYTVPGQHTTPDSQLYPHQAQHWHTLPLPSCHFDRLPCKCHRRCRKAWLDLHQRRGNLPGIGRRMWPQMANSSQLSRSNKLWTNLCQYLRSLRRTDGKIPAKGSCKFQVHTWRTECSEKSRYQLYHLNTGHMLSIRLQSTIHCCIDRMGLLGQDPGLLHRPSTPCKPFRQQQNIRQQYKQCKPFQEINPSQLFLLHNQCTRRMLNTGRLSMTHRLWPHCCRCPLGLWRSRHMQQCPQPSSRFPAHMLCTSSWNSALSLETRGHTNRK